MKTGKLVSDFCTDKVVSVTPQASVNEVFTIMNAQKISCVLVQDADELIGIFTERDAVRLFNESPAPGDTPISKEMSRDVITINSDSTLHKAILLMHEKSIRRLPVVDRDIVVGVITLSDLLEELYHDVVASDHVINNTIEGIVISRSVSTDGKRRFELLRANSSVRKLLGYSNTELATLSFRKFIPGPADRIRVLRALSLAAKGGESNCSNLVKARVATKTGHTKHVELCIGRISSSDDGRILVCGVDTSRFQKEEKENKRFFDYSPIPMAKINVENLAVGSIAEKLGQSHIEGENSLRIDGNDALYDFFEIDDRENASPLDWLPEDVMSVLYEGARKWLANMHRSYVIQRFQIYTFKGASRHISIHMTPAIEGSNQGILTIIDETELAEQNIRLERSQGHLQQQSKLRNDRAEAYKSEHEALKEIIDFAPIGFARCRPSGEFLFANEAYRQMLGYGPEIADMNAHDLHVDCGKRHAMKRLLEESEDGTVKCFKAELRHKAGHVVPTERNIRRVVDEKGEVFFESYVTDRSSELSLKKRLSNVRYRSKKQSEKLEDYKNTLDEQLKNNDRSEINTLFFKRTAFEDNPIPVWYEDMSKVKDVIDKAFEGKSVADVDEVFKDRALVEQCVDAILVKEVNHAGAKMVGYSASEIKELGCIPAPGLIDANEDSFRREFVALAKDYLSGKEQSSITEGLPFRYQAKNDKWNNGILYLHAVGSQQSAGGFFSLVVVFIVDTTALSNHMELREGRQHLSCGGAGKLLSLLSSKTEQVDFDESGSSKETLELIRYIAYCLPGTLPLFFYQLSQRTSAEYSACERVDLWELFRNLKRMWRELGTLNPAAFELSINDSEHSDSRADCYVTANMSLLCCALNLMVGIGFGDCRGSGPVRMRVDSGSDKTCFAMSFIKKNAKESCPPICPKGHAFDKAVELLQGEYSESISQDNEVSLSMTVPTRVH